MGSSTASTTETIINTSTDSASTIITNVTHTDTSETCDSLDLGKLLFSFLVYNLTSEVILYTRRPLNVCLFYLFI